MQPYNPQLLVARLQRRWRLQALLVHSGITLAIVILCVIICHLLQVNIAWGIGLGAAGAVLLFWLNQSWRISEADVVRYLNNHCPALEQSTQLLLQPAQALNFLEQLQVHKLQTAIGALPPLHPLRKKLRLAGMFLLLSVVLAALLLHVHGTTRPVAASITTSAPVAEKKLPGIAAVNITLTPPAYIGKSMRSQQNFALDAEEGALAQWVVHTNTRVNNLQFLFNDSSVLSLKPADTSHTVWKAQKQLLHSGFYQVQLDKQLSGLYKIALVKDQPAVITIQTPKPYTVIDYGQPRQVNLQATIADDYGVHDAFITATIASGSGEAVKFKEQKILFDNSFQTQQPKYTVSKTISLSKLGMQPGDELYFFIQATDTHNQQTRSDILIVSLPDTAQLMSLDGIVNSVNLKPEYFRSERQIILDAEQLLREKDTITTEAFNNRSNNLGIDQKLLRLRYGKFLGEESESGEPETGNTPDKIEDFGNAAAILDRFTDKHDNAEDASFFDAETKKQLKATLTEMWNTELRLRTFKPQEALPYAYKALRLLKDLQQKSRAYVAKTGVKVTALKPEKRLTGDLSKIITPVTQEQYPAAAPQTANMRKALGMLEQLRAGETPAGAAVVLQDAVTALSLKAAAEPAQYLSSFEAIRRVLLDVQQNHQPAVRDVLLTAQALQQLLPQPAQYPAAAPGNDGSRLSRQYFHNLNQQQNKP